MPRDVPSDERSACGTAYNLGDTVLTSLSRVVKMQHVPDPSIAPCVTAGIIAVVAHAADLVTAIGRIARGYNYWEVRPARKYTVRGMLVHNPAGDGVPMVVDGCFTANDATLLFAARPRVFSCRGDITIRPPEHCRLHIQDVEILRVGGGQSVAPLVRIDAGAFDFVDDEEKGHFRCVVCGALAELCWSVIVLGRVRFVFTRVLQELF